MCEQQELPPTPSEPGRLPRWVRHALCWVGCLVALTWVLGRLPGAANLAPDYIQFWSASSILAAGGNPYDPSLQAEQNAAQGWDIEREGIGKYAFLPYYYPPWLALALVPLLPLGFATAKLTWLAILLESIFAAAYLLRRSVPGMHSAAVMAICLCFGVWWTTVPIGQVAPLVVLLLVAFWRLADADFDWAAGMALAGLSIKPQLTACLVVAAMIWAVRRGRWKIVAGCATGVAALVLVSSIVRPDWLPAMLDAPRQTPLVTTDRPWVGASWFSLLRTIGCEGLPLWLAYLAMAAPVGVILFQTAWKRETDLFDVLAVSAWGAFLLVPYLRYYDLPILLLPLLRLLSSRLAENKRTLLVLSFMIIPVAIWIVTPGEPSPLVSQLQWLWMMVALAGGWLGARAARTAPSTAPVAGAWQDFAT
jgi:hypothetical protein